MARRDRTIDLSIVITAVIQLCAFMGFILFCAFVYDLLFPVENENRELSAEEREERLKKGLLVIESSSPGENSRGKEDDLPLHEEISQLRQVLDRKLKVDKRHRKSRNILETTS